MDTKITLRAARVNAGKTQKAVADEIGVSNTTIVKWEKGSVIPRADALRRLCALYGVPETLIFLPGESAKSELH